MICVIVATLMLLRIATCDAVAAVESLEKEASSVPHKELKQTKITAYFSPKPDKAEEPVVEEATDATQASTVVEKAEPSGPSNSEQRFHEVMDIYLSGNLAYMMAINLFLREALFNYVCIYLWAAGQPPGRLFIRLASPDFAKAQLLMDHFGISFEVLDRRFSKDWAKLWYNLAMYKWNKETGHITDPNAPALFHEEVFTKYGLTDANADPNFQSRLAAFSKSRTRARTAAANPTPNEQPKTTTILFCAFSICLLIAFFIAAVAVGFASHCDPAAAVTDVVQPTIVIPVVNYVPALLNFGTNATPW